MKGQFIKCAEVIETPCFFYMNLRIISTEHSPVLVPDTKRSRRQRECITPLPDTRDRHNVTHLGPVCRLGDLVRGVCVVGILPGDHAQELCVVVTPVLVVGPDIDQLKNVSDVICDLIFRPSYKHQ